MAGIASDKALTGSAGVLYVAFQLSSRGHAVGLTASGVKGVDLLAGNAETARSISIQVKTMRVAHVDIGKPHERWKWRISKQLAEGPAHRDFLVAFVDLHLPEGAPSSDEHWHPDVFIVPSSQLHKFVQVFGPAKAPTDFWFVVPVRDAYKYRNRWDYIEKILG